MLGLGRQDTLVNTVLIASEDSVFSNPLPVDNGFSIFVSLSTIQNSTSFFSLTLISTIKLVTSDNNLINSLFNLGTTLLTIVLIIPFLPKTVR